jgi:hypothetical protein
VKAGLEEKPYWRDVGTIDAFWQANIDLTDFVPELDLYDRSWPIWTYSEIVPPAKFIHDEEGRRGAAVFVSIRRLHHFGDGGAQFAAFHRRCIPTPTRCWITRCAAAM